MLLTDSYFTKSFYLLGKSLPKCFNCTYCRLEGTAKDLKYEKLCVDLEFFYNSSC